MASNKNNKKKTVSSSGGRNGTRPNGKAWKKSHKPEELAVLVEEANGGHQATVARKAREAKLKSTENKRKKGRRNTGGAG